MERVEENKIEIPEAKSYELADKTKVDLSELEKSIKNKKEQNQQKPIEK